MGFAELRHCSRSLAGLTAFAAWLGCGAVIAVAQDPAPAPTKAAEAHVLWQYAPPGSSFEEVLTADGMVFVLDRAGKIHALDAATGDVRWVSEGRIEFSFGYGIASSPRPGFAAILVGCDTGLIALDQKSGKPLWSTAIDKGVAGPACTQDAVIAGGADGKVHACDLLTGKLLWEHDYLGDRPEDPPGFQGADARFDGRPARPGAAATDGAMVALSVFDQCRTLAIDAKSGKRLWDFRTQGWMYGRPTFGTLHVFVGSQDDHVYGVDKELGKQAWNVATGSRNEAAATAADRFVYFGSCDGNLYAVDQMVGRVVWQFATEKDAAIGSPIYGRPVVVGDTVYLAVMNGIVYAVDRRSGKQRWQFRPVAKCRISGDLATDGERLFVAAGAPIMQGEAGKSAVFAIAPQ